jgi:hypothetical protein
MLHPVGQVDDAPEFFERGRAVEDAPQAVVGQVWKPCARPVADFVGGGAAGDQFVDAASMRSSSMIAMRPR